MAITNTTELRTAYPEPNARAGQKVLDPLGRNARTLKIKTDGTCGLDLRGRNT